MASKKLTDGSVPAATTTTGLQLYGVQDGATKRVDAGLLGGVGGGGGGSGAANEYHADEWLKGASTGVVTQLRQMAAAVPAGSTIIMPNRQLTVSGPVYFNQANLTIKGQRGASIVKGTAGLLQGEPLFGITNSNCSVEGVGFAPLRHADQAGGGFGLAFGAYYRNRAYNPSAALAGPLLNPRVIDCDFIDGSEGLIFLADTNGGVIRQVLDPVVQGNRFKNLDYQAISLFGATGGDYSGNHFKMAPHRTDANGVAYGFACVMRVLSGSSGYHIHHNKVEGLGLNANPASDGRSSFIYFCGMSLDGFQAVGLYGGQVDHNDVSNQRVMWQFSHGPMGQLLIDGNTLTNPDSNALTTSYPAIWEPTAPLGGAPVAFDELVLRNNRYRGVNEGFSGISGYIDRLELDGERVRWGGKVPNGSAACVATTTYSGSIPTREVQVERCKFEFPDGAAEIYVSLDLNAANSRASVVGNEFPPGVPAYGFITATGAGAIRTEFNGAYKATGAIVSPGDNAAKALVAGGGGGSGGGGGATNYVVNGDFNSAAGWTLPTGTSISDGKLKFVAGNEYPSVARTDANIPPNTQVKITVVVSARTSGQISPRVSIGFATFAIPIPAWITAAGTHEFVVTTAPDQVSSAIALYAEPNFVGEIDSWKIQPV